MDNMNVRQRKTVIKALTIFFAVLCAILLICGIVNVSKPIPAGTTYNCGTKSITFKIGSLYEYKRYQNGEQTEHIVGKYGFSDDGVILYSFYSSGNNKTLIFDGDNLKGGDDIYKSEPSWLSIVLLLFGIISGFLSLLGGATLRRKSQDSTEPPPLNDLDADNTLTVEEQSKGLTDKSESGTRDNQ